MQQREQDILHARVSVWQISGLTQRCTTVGSAGRLAFRDRQDISISLRTGTFLFRFDRIATRHLAFAVLFG
jgi:hypothetical protein